MNTTNTTNTTETLRAFLNRGDQTIAIYKDSRINTCWNIQDYLVEQDQDKNMWVWKSAQCVSVGKIYAQREVVRLQLQDGSLTLTGAKNDLRLDPVKFFEQYGYGDDSFEGLVAWDGNNHKLINLSALTEIDLPKETQDFISSACCYNERVGIVSADEIVTIDGVDYNIAYSRFSDHSEYRFLTPVD